MMMATKDNLDWNVGTRDLSYEVDGNTYYVPFKKAHFRDDTNQCVGVTGQSYEVFQNSSLKEFVTPLVEEGILEIVNMGVLGVGQKVFIQAQMTQDFTIVGENHKGMISLLNSHDGTSALAAGVTDKRVICNNTFAMAMGDMSTRLKHSRGLDDKSKQIDAIINFVNERMTMFSEHAEQLASTKSNILMVDHIIEEAYGKPADSVRAANNIRQFYRNGIGTNGETLWDAVNAFTQYTTHEMGKDDSRFTSVNFGRGAKLNRAAVNAALALV